MGKVIAGTATAVGRGVRRVVVTLLVSAGLIAVTSGVAHAGTWQMNDGFEYNPAGTWTLYHSGVGGGGFDLNAGTARTGYNNAWLSVQTGWSSVGRSVYLTPAQLHQSSCGAGIYIAALSGARLNFEVINPSTWTYVALKTVTLSGGGYTLVTVGPWVPGPTTVFIRVSLLGSGAFNAVRVDDLIVQCQYAY